jgi:four helix bundle protein
MLRAATRRADKALMTQTSRNLPHQRLRIYWTARELRRLVFTHPLGHADLRNQAERAANSVVLNISEGAVLLGNAKKRHYRIAYGSAVEIAAAYEIGEQDGLSPAVAEIFDHVDHIVAVMTKLLRR